MFFCSESFKKTWKHHLFDDFRPLRDWEKSCTGSSGNGNGNGNNNSSSNNKNKNNKKKKKTKKKKKQQTPATTTATATATTKTSKFMIRALPAGPQPQRNSEDIPDRMPERIAENIWDKMRKPDSMSENMSKWGSLEESNLFRRLSKIDLRQPKWRLVGPCGHHRHHQQR